MEIPAPHVIMAVALTLGGCAGGGSFGSFAGGAPAPDVAMSGRWMLAAPNAPSCGIEMRASSSGQDGALAPDGGCPGQFYLGRRWTFRDGQLLITTETDEPLARLAYTGGRFEGKTTAGTPVSLSR